MIRELTVERCQLAWILAVDICVLEILPRWESSPLSRDNKSACKRPTGPPPTMRTGTELGISPSLEVTSVGPESPILSLWQLILLDELEVGQSTDI